ncbi:SusC/RagA family TonB-linked outer membrane protein [Flagellimonas baculiformis]|uniref:SusC/RagA family TonB-linked outer membrane protein n=1 Tax=Flagellimonas baculiformis TaxID=3067310 RepID=UPI00296E7BFA|nr:SusC/RagA family TonB-linked outer membrane protein [Muricauda sp. D6]
MIQKLKFVFVFAVLLSVQGAMAQTITGTVSDESGVPLPGVNIVEKGTSNGVSSDFDGNYSITVSDGNATLVFSSLGMRTAEIGVAGRTTVNLTMEEDAEQLGEVVVTALGIKKETKALGYSITEVGGEKLSEVKQVNAINALQGKIAGVNITGAATGPSGTSKVVIRGVSSVNGTAQPLYIVDGIPIDNQNLGSATRWGGADFGDGISSINPDDIESVSVLKGGAAGALYGSRASNGVIVITTKSGKGQQGLGVEVSSSAQFETINTDLYDFQTEYGQGLNGVAPTTAEEARDAGMQSWGPRLGSVSSAVQFDGVSRPYEYTGNNLTKYYRTASTFINTVAVSKAGEGYNVRFSATDLTNNDLVPNSGLNRKSFSLNAGAVLADKLTMDISGKYVVEGVQNRPRTSDSPGNGNFVVALSGPNIDVRDYRPGYNEDGTEFRVSSSTYHQNPYWTAYRFENESNKNRFIGSSTLRYQVTDWLYLMGRAGIDQYTARITQVEPFGTAYKPLGGMTEQNYNVKTVDADFIIGFEKDITEDFSNSTLVGANSNSFTNEFTQLIGNDFVIPSLVDIANVSNRNYEYRLDRVKKNGLYFSTEFSYRNYLYLTVTGRNDWFSTLSKSNKSAPNSYFYPSVNASFVLSDALSLPEWVSFSKLRAGYSEVGGGANDPYQLALTYAITDNYSATGPGVPLGSINNSTLPNEELKPFTKKEYEIGLDLRFLNNRLGVDFAYYNNKTIDDIVPINISNASGYSSAIINIGELTNKGIELLLTGSPIRSQNFGWDISYNMSYNKSEVVRTDEDGNPVFPGDAAYGVNSQAGFIEGYPAASIYGTTYIRDEQGRIQYDANGTPSVGPNEVIGQGIAPWTMGLTNTFNYKNFNLSFLIDAKFGGDIFSGTSAFASYYGASKSTLVGRENGLTVTGVDANGADFTSTIAPENVGDYYRRIYEIAEAHIQDASFIKFRQISLGYNLPSSILEKTFISNVNISFIGRNLFFLMKHTENIDPESAYNNTFANGIERFGLPATRSYGLSLNVKF